jgi:hypothetical protein
VQFLCTCQVYGRQRREGRAQARDIDCLLAAYPTMRVAFIDTEAAGTGSSAGSAGGAVGGVGAAGGGGAGRDAGRGAEGIAGMYFGGPGDDGTNYYSVLLRRSSDAGGGDSGGGGFGESGFDHGFDRERTHPGAAGWAGGEALDERVAAHVAPGSASGASGPAGGGAAPREVYRVQLPGNPVLGEGKPENQNHCVIFARGEFVQTIDMNQDGYLEESLKMPNALATAEPAPYEADPQQPPTAIVGIREHVFTGGVSNCSTFMQLQELTFVTLTQRLMANPLRVRMHYGHPDVFDKLFAITRGGLSKASKGINLSEDVFAGMNLLPLDIHLDIYLDRAEGARRANLPYSLNCYVFRVRRNEPDAARWARDSRGVPAAGQGQGRRLPAAGAV